MLESPVVFNQEKMQLYVDLEISVWEWVRVKSSTYSFLSPNCPGDLLFGKNACDRLFVHSPSWANLYSGGSLRKWGSVKTSFTFPCSYF